MHCTESGKDLGTV